MRAVIYLLMEIRDARYYRCMMIKCVVERGDLVRLEAQDNLDIVEKKGREG